MVTVDIIRPDGSKHHLYIDGYLKANMDLALEHAKKDFDMVFVVDGPEGAGKSVLTQQVACYVDPTLCMDRICFTPDSFSEAVLKAKMYEAVIYDDAYGGLGSRSSMSDINKKLVTLLTLIRAKRLFVFIVMPAIFEMDKYPAVWRSRALFHVTLGPKFQRGFFSFYSSERKKFLYIKGKKFYEYKIKPDFKGRFCKGYYVDEKEYRNKKQVELENYDPAKNEGSEKRMNAQRNGIMYALGEKGWTSGEIADLITDNSKFKIDERTVRQTIQRHKEKMKEDSR